jgi:succinate dehydrogenase / fumarate reductase iron-sulfur subunit
LQVKILRRDAPAALSYWEIFDVEVKKGYTVINVLEAIQKSPINAAGKAITPVALECNCLEEVCGACAMLINGKPQMACGAFVENVCKNDVPLILEPLSIFPVVRDLVVDRARIYETYRRWGVYVDPDDKPDERVSVAGWGEAYASMQCMSCGCCAEACPNVGMNSRFMGAIGISLCKVLLETGRMRDIGALTHEGGVAECSGHSLCAAACPKNIDLPGAFASVNRVILKSLFNLYRGPSCSAKIR